MKTDLSTFPNCTRTQDSRFWMWKENFTKELQKNLKPHCECGACQIIKEILGQ